MLCRIKKYYSSVHGVLQVTQQLEDAARVARLHRARPAGAPDLAVVIDGRALAIALGGVEAKARFLELGMACKVFCLSKQFAFIKGHAQTIDQDSKTVQHVGDCAGGSGGKSALSKAGHGVQGAGTVQVVCGFCLKDAERWRFRNLKEWKRKRGS